MYILFVRMEVVLVTHHLATRHNQLGYLHRQAGKSNRGNLPRLVAVPQ
jgi:hypothetical protein